MKKTTKYDLSKHATDRLEDRNISEDTLNLILKFGKRKKHGGRTLVFWKNYKAVLTNPDDIVLTVYRKGTDLHPAFA